MVKVKVVWRDGDEVRSIKGELREREGSKNQFVVVRTYDRDFKIHEDSIIKIEEEITNNGM